MSTRRVYEIVQPQTATTGHLFATRPWYSRGFSGELPSQVGELLTLTLEDNSALHVQYPFPRHSSPREFKVGDPYRVEDLGVDYSGSDPGVCYELGGMRLFRISELR